MFLPRISILTFLVFCFFPFGGKAKTECWRSGWVKKSPPENSQYRYYIGRASGNKADPEKILVNQARKDAREIAIEENFGILTSIQRQSYQSLDSTTALNRTSEVSKSVILEEFRQENICWQVQKKKKNLWILFKYSKQKIKKEQGRLEKQKSVDDPQFFSEINTTGKARGGFLQVVTSSPGISLSIGEHISKTPVKIRLIPGLHEFTLDSPYFKTYEQQILIERGEVHKVFKTMEPAKREIQIKTEPEGAEVYLAGKYLGLTPIENTVVFTGESLGILITHPETEPYRTNITLGKGEEKYVWDRQLSFKPSYLFVKSMPQGADVYIDGRFTGKTPTKFIETQRGEREIVLKTKDYPDYRFHVHLKGGERKILETIKLTHKSEKEINRRDIGGPLHLAAYDGDIKTARQLIQNEAHVNSKANLWRVNPLYWAAQKGHIDIVKLLLMSKSKLNIKDRDGLTPLHVATQEGHTKVVELLVNSKAKVNIRDKWGHIPLHWATYHGHTDIAKLLIANKSKLNVKNKEGDTPLHLATQEGSKETTELLIRSKANLNLKNKRGFIPLHWATYYGHAPIAKLLIGSKSRINVKNKDHLTPLHIAIDYGHIEIGELLIQSGSNLNIKNKEGFTPLHIAIERDRTKITNLLIKRGAKLNIKNKVGFTPLQIATSKQRRRENTRMSELLVKGGAKLDVKNKEGLTPLYMVMRAGNLRTAEVLIKGGADLNVQNKWKQTPLHLAIMEGYTEIAKLLILKRAHLNIKDEDGLTPLQIATPEHKREKQSREQALVELLIKKGANVNVKDSKGFTPLHWATRYEYTDIVDRLIKHDADPNVQHKKFSTPLHIAVGKRNREIMEILIKGGAKLHFKDNWGQTPLQVATPEYEWTKENIEIAKTLIVKGSNVNVKNKKNFTPLHWSARHGHTEIVKLLLERGANSNVRNREKGFTPLHWATQENHLDIVDLLLKHRANPNIKDKYGRVPLYLAIKSNYTKIATLIIKSGLSNVNIRTQKGLIPLQYATPQYGGEGSVEIAELLIKHGSYVKVKNDKNFTPLHWAAYHGHTKIAKMLIQHGADANIKSEEKGFSPLHLASIYGYTIIAELLIQHGSNVNAKSKYHRATPLHLAIKNKHEDIAELLIKNQANVNMKDREGNTPLRMANSKGERKVAGLLTKYGAKEEGEKDKNLLVVALFGTAEAIGSAVVVSAEAVGGLFEYAWDSLFNEDR